MTEFLPPRFADDIDWLSRHCKVPVHVGLARIARHGDPNDPLNEMALRIQQATGQTPKEPEEQEFSASFLVPAFGPCKIFLHWSGEHRLSRNFGEGLSVAGESPDGPFLLTCPEYYVKVVSERNEQPRWAILSLTNSPAVVEYGNPRPVARVVANVNNFDFDYGNFSQGVPETPKVLRLHAGGHTVDFEWRAERAKLRQLVQAQLLKTTSLVTLSFDSWDGATESELVDFARNVSTLCGYVVGQLTGLPVFSFFDSQGRLVKRLFYDVVESEFRIESALRVPHADSGLPRLFALSFDEHCRMQKSEHWLGFANLFSVIEDPPFMEQKYGTLMAALELFLRNSLVEGGHLQLEDAKKATLPKLVDMARARLKWEVPEHYTREDRYRHARNAVQHGDSFPFSIEQVLADFQKWKLFLRRRLFLRLGFDGDVASPEKGWASSSPVNEFSEEHNSFGG